MPTIHLQTLIHAPIGICFDLSRNIDLHIVSTRQTNERAIAGRTTGLIGLGETVTWRAKHLGVYQELTTCITDFRYPVFFADEMVRGAFASFRHAHYFTEQVADTLMEDVFTFRSPLGFLGALANRLFLTHYMTQLLQKRNRVIKRCAEDLALSGSCAGAGSTIL